MMDQYIIQYKEYGDWYGCCHAFDADAKGRERVIADYKRHRDRYLSGNRRVINRKMSETVLSFEETVTIKETK